MRTNRCWRAIIRRAIKLFDTLEGRFPYGRLAQQAILEGAYANYRQGEATTAIAACDRFIRTYPNHPNVDYAYYLKGLVNFREDQGILGYLVETDLSERDPKMTKESFGAFRELVTRFPDSKYAEDSIERMQLSDQCARGIRGPGRALLLQPRRLRSRGEPRAGHADQLSEDARERRRAGTADGELRQARYDAATRRHPPGAEGNLPQREYFVASAGKPWWKFWGKDEPPPLLSSDTAKPWWKFW